MNQFWRRIIAGACIGASLYLVYDSLANAAPSDGRTPTPMQIREKDKKELEDRLQQKRIALAYGCGYIEARTRLVTAECMETRSIARDNGFKP